MKKQTLWLMLAGTLCMSIPVLSRSFITLPVDIADILTGLGVGIMTMALILQKKSGCPGCQTPTGSGNINEDRQNTRH